MIPPASARIGTGFSQTPKAFRSTPPQIQQTPSVRPQPQRVVIRPTAQPKKKAAVSRSSLSDHSKHEREDTKRLHGRSSERLGASIERITAEPAKISPTMAILNTGELTPELLRRMVILKEIFDKPLALRDSEIWDRL